MFRPIPALAHATLHRMSHRAWIVVSELVSISTTGLLLLFTILAILHT